MSKGFLLSILSPSLTKMHIVIRPLWKNPQFCRVKFKQPLLVWYACQIACYCRSCQIKSGSDHLAYIAVDIDAVKITGSVTWYESIGDSGNTKQHGFCDKCGTNLFGKPSFWPHILVVYAGSLNDPVNYKPEVNLWLQDAPLWACIDNKLEMFDKNPG